MLFESHFYQVLIVAMLTGLIFTIGYKFWAGVKTEEVDKAIMNLKISIFSTGFICIVLLFLLPINPSLYFPEIITEIPSDE